MTELSAEYAEEFVKAIVEYICKEVSRFKTTSEDDKSSIANRLYAYSHDKYRFGHLKLFADMLIDSKLSTRKVVGGQVVDDGRLILFDRQSVMEKWAIFVDIVNKHDAERAHASISDASNENARRTYQEAVRAEPEQMSRIKGNMSNTFSNEYERQVFVEAQRLYHEAIRYYYQKGMQTDKFDDYYEVMRAGWVGYVNQAKENLRTNN